MSLRMTSLPQRGYDFWDAELWRSRERKGREERYQRTGGEEAPIRMRLEGWLTATTVVESSSEYFDQRMENKVTKRIRSFVRMSERNQNRRKFTYDR